MARKAVLPAAVQVSAGRRSGGTKSTPALVAVRGPATPQSPRRGRPTLDFKMRNPQAGSQTGSSHAKPDDAGPSTASAPGGQSRVRPRNQRPQRVTGTSTAPAKTKPKPAKIGKKTAVAAPHRIVPSRAVRNVGDPGIQGAPLPGRAVMPIPIPGHPMGLPPPMPPIRRIPPFLGGGNDGAVAVLRRGLRGQPGLGVAPVINVGNSRHFATTFGGLTKIGEIKMPLVNGSIQINGHNAKIICKARAKTAKDDIVTISRFIKRFFRLGGTIGKRKMSSLALVRYVVKHLPGTFNIIA